jgi:hypothetical protein
MMLCRGSSRVASDMYHAVEIPKKPDKNAACVVKKISPKAVMGIRFRRAKRQEIEKRERRDGYALEGVLTSRPGIHQKRSANLVRSGVTDSLVDFQSDEGSLSRKTTAEKQDQTFLINRNLLASFQHFAPFFRKNHTPTH